MTNPEILELAKTCGFDDMIGERDEEEMEKPNFEVPSENFSLTWYKYPFRGSYSSEKLTPKRWNDLIQKCIKSLEELN
jgi:hypothetical protein